MKKLTQSLQAFGLNPDDWTFRILPDGSVLLSKITDPDIRLLGKMNGGEISQLDLDLSALARALELPA